MASSSAADWDPVKAWLATVAGTTLDGQEAAAASILLGRRVRELTGILSVDPQVTKPPGTPPQDPTGTRP